ncbi:7448_t:CDS:2 [Diversispora eburnea]|uniref:7448_t:CDS:1 n=1 Tax=Diversispora eburnea TaxID=1213867 RepID=A0A9N9A6W7_9GLOM|nr:7448_t:CDS:2 [Diversispora eburnea]
MPTSVITPCMAVRIRTIIGESNLSSKFKYKEQKEKMRSMISPNQIKHTKKIKSFKLIPSSILRTYLELNSPALLIVLKLSSPKPTVNTHTDSGAVISEIAKINELEVELTKSGSACWELT